MSFSELGVPSWLLTTLSTLKITHPTPVQTHCIPPILHGKNVIGCSETGSGKTIAFSLPILQKLAEDPCGIFGVILTPTRELALQISQQLKVLGSAIGVKVCLIVGGVDQVGQSALLERRPHLVVGTPGRLCELMEIGVGEWRRVRFVVVDEADRVIGREGRLVKKVLEKCRNFKQVLLFSATMTRGLERIVRVGKSGESEEDGEEEEEEGFFVYDERKRLYEPVKTLTQRYLFIPPRLRLLYLYHLLQVLYPSQDVIIFVSKCYTAEYVATSLSMLGLSKIGALHSEMKQSDRLKVLQRFKGKTIRVLVATDIASRGLDIPTIHLVINYNIPKVTATYIHRVGRTARAGRRGLVVNFITPFDVELVQGIEREIGNKWELLEGVKEKKVTEELGAVFKVERVARLKLQDEGFTARCEIRHEIGKENALKRKRKAEKRNGNEKEGENQGKRTKVVG